MNFFKKKSFELVRQSGAASGLNKTLGAFDLILFGLGGIIGTGVFVLTGLVAANYSGPAVTISYSIAGVTCILVALAYTELATMLPTSGSIYTYSYVAFGEVFAWLIGSILIIELGFASSVVAAGWSAYVQGIFAAAQITIPKALVTTPAEGGIVNLPAILIIAFVTLILYLGTKESKRLNAILVFIKMGAIFAFVISAAPHFDVTNWKNFTPFGFDKILVGSSILFFAFTGFGNIAAAAEECKNPKRDIIIGIVGSVVLSTIVYVLVGGLVTGIISFEHLNTGQPLAHALTLNNSKIGSAIVATGAVCGMTTVIMMNIYALSRIFYVAARDGLLPRSFAKLHPKYDSPYITILVFSGMAAILGGFFPLKLLGQLSSMAALMDYMTVALIVMLFRIKMPHVPRSFKCPIIFIIGPAALIACTILLFKQIFDDQTGILGQFLIYWFAGMFGLYVVRSLLMKPVS